MDERRIDDQQVVEWVRAGCRDEVLAALLPEYRRKVFSLAYGILRDAAAAEDVAQEVFVKVWRALPSYDARAKLSTWIYAITRNASISALRARKSTVSISDEAVMGEAERTLSERADDGEHDEALGPDVLGRHIAQLPEKQRQVLTLFYMQEKSYDEVAAMLRMPLGSVKNTLFRARATLQQAMSSPREPA